MSLPVESLSDIESARLRRKENVIERSAGEVAEALAVIRDERLYRATHSTFEDYCRERWGMTNRHVNRKIVAAEVATALGPMGPEITERQARELADLRDDPDALREVYQAASEATEGKVTAAAIRAVRTPEPTPEPACDRPKPTAITPAISEPVATATPEPEPEPAKVIGLDGKEYAAKRPSAPATHPEPPPSTIEADIAEFPDLAYFAEVGRSREIQWLAFDLRRFRQRGELESRLDTLRRSIEIDRSKRDGTYEPPELPSICLLCGRPKD